MIFFDDASNFIMNLKSMKKTIQVQSHELYVQNHI